MLVNQDKAFVVGVERFKGLLTKWRSCFNYGVQSRVICVR